MAMKCPLCQQIAHVRSSEYQSDTVKCNYMQCRNIHCSCTFVTLESLSHIISRPAVDSDDNQAKTEIIKLKEPENLDTCLNKYGDNFKYKDRHAE
ncbi:ogr/Delta-like zinc finger family protein [Providencia manganoxydans]|uniref:ogr/Delta-like zinc finger family protein n=1 Tax=Providencia manganoxydans TaxID=2923283 RepID=UPI0034E3D2E8